LKINANKANNAGNENNANKANNAGNENNANNERSLYDLN